MPSPMRFADSAARLWGQCALMLGWRPDEFWTATPAEISAIFDAAKGPQADAALGRADLHRLMEQDNG